MPIRGPCSDDFCLQFYNLLFHDCQNTSGSRVSQTSSNNSQYAGSTISNVERHRQAELVGNGVLAPWKSRSSTLLSEVVAASIMVHLIVILTTTSRPPCLFGPQESGNRDGSNPLEIAEPCAYGDQFGHHWHHAIPADFYDLPHPHSHERGQG